MKRSYKLGLVVVPIVLGIGAVAALNAWSSGPAEGTIHTGIPSTATKPAEQAAPLTIQAAFFSAKLPTGFIQKDASPPTSQVSVRVLATNTSSRQQIGISGGALPKEGLIGVADYNLRVKDTASYKRATSTSLPSGAVAFEDTAGSMLTVFWPHGGNYVSLTVSGSPGSLRDLNELLSKILQNWQWK
ncbi:hypothetical protein EYC59_03815 [Candidatus Saccharibacteria bacterium]|nr:MAG: hypothetical protein EYC59_03815 [Candidatus Saccharibacteria bacterium]